MSGRGSSDGGAEFCLCAAFRVLEAQPELRRIAKTGWNVVNGFGNAGTRQLTTYIYFAGDGILRTARRDVDGDPDETARFWFCTATVG